MSTQGHHSLHLAALDFYLYWSDLEKTNPARLQIERLLAISAVISTADADKQESLWVIQRRIDTELAKESDQMGRMFRAFEMFREQLVSKDGFARLPQLLRELQDELIEHQILLDQLPGDVHELSATFLATHEALSKISKS